MAISSRAFLFFGLLALASPGVRASDPAPAPELLVHATIDYVPLVCRASHPLHLSSTAQGLTLLADCAGPAPLDCIVDTLDLDGLSLTVQCHSASGSGAFRAVHLPQILSLAPGGDGTLLVQVYNTTGQALHSLAVTASAVPACAATHATLASGAVWQYTCAVANVHHDLTDALAVTARTPANAMLVAHAAMSVMVQGPRIGLDVTPIVQQSIGPFAVWTVSVHNAGTTALTNVLEADDQPDSSCILGPVASLAPNMALTYTCVRGSIEATFIALHSAAASAGSASLRVDVPVIVHYGTTIFMGGFE